MNNLHSYKTHVWKTKFRCGSSFTKITGYELGNRGLISGTYICLYICLYVLATVVHQTDSKIGFYPWSPVFPCHYYYTGAQYSYINWETKNRSVGGRSSETHSYPIYMNNNKKLWSTQTPIPMGCARLYTCHARLNPYSYSHTIIWTCRHCKHYTGNRSQYFIWGLKSNYVVISLLLRISSQLIIHNKLTLLCNFTAE
jgi:hypothetical protein